MKEIKAYLLRIILCGFLLSLWGAFFQGRQEKKALTLCGGCLMILVVVQPLLRVDLTRLPSLWQDLDPGIIRSPREAAEENDRLLQRMVEDQTRAWLLAQAEAAGIPADFDVTAEKAAEGLFVPCAVEIRGGLSAPQRQTLEALLDQLEIPPERRNWRGT